MGRSDLEGFQSLQGKVASRSAIVFSRYRERSRRRCTLRNAGVPAHEPMAKVPEDCQSNVERIVP